MPARGLPHSLLAPISHSIKLSPHRIARPSSTLSAELLTSLPSSSTSSASISSLTYSERKHFQGLLDTLESPAADPNDVWANYSTVLSQFGASRLPLEIHQQVLRRCTPSKSQLKRVVIANLAPDPGQKKMKVAQFEKRFQFLVSNIHNQGAIPSLEDYNYIIQQLTALGRYQSTLRVYEEIKRIGHIPDSTTFCLCLQALAFRLTLPAGDKRKDLVAVIQSMFKLYMSDMRKFEVPLTGVSMDLVLRILKETVNSEDFEALMRWGYGVDLSNPDRIPLEYADMSSSSSKTLNKIPSPFPFTTTTLNTTIDMLGRLGNISKLVQAFEVLTQPLPQASQHFFNNFESDEDDDYGVSIDPPPPRFPCPCAPPNTTTYSTLLRHICAQGHHTFARHYILQAIKLDRATSWKLRWTVSSYHRRKKSLKDVMAPHFAINRAILSPVLTESSRDKNLGLMKWLSTKMAYIIRKQKADLEFYLGVREEREKAGLDVPSSPPPRTKLITPVLDLDVEDRSPPVEISIQKPFNINLHIGILQRNVAELEVFNERLEFHLGRAYQRVKERLGRRIWKSKDIYLVSEGKRVEVTKAEWKDKVNFKPSHGAVAGQLQESQPGRKSKYKRYMTRLSDSLKS